VPPSPTPNPTAFAELISSQNEVIGLATFTEDAEGVHIRIAVANLTPGEHGMHIHEVGICEPPDFTSAGDHLNPLNREHGLENPQGPHAGDLPNFVVGEDGTARTIVVTDRVTLRGGPTSLFDSDGSALVIHAGPDDQMTNPAGNSGDRVACGVIKVRQAQF
jgi:Cu-Zn family superoxide dismutase